MKTLKMPSNLDFFMKCFLPIFIISFSASTAYAQDTLDIHAMRITYFKAYKNYRDFSPALPKKIEHLNYRLVLNKTESRFEYIPNVFTQAEGFDKRSISRMVGRGIYYKNLDTHEHLMRNPEKKYLVQKKFVIYDWVLLDEVKTILGYECFKAVGSYDEYNYFLKEVQTLKATVWYAPDLPYAFGPSAFDGLPGLVLEANRGNLYLTASNIEFLEDSIEIKKPSGILIEDEKYAEIQYNETMMLINRD